jgi:hypothetical protein
VQRITVNGNKATDEGRNNEIAALIHHTVLCSDRFIHRFVYKLAIYLLWCELTGEVMSHITCGLL